MALVNPNDYLKYIAVGVSLGVIGCVLIPKLFAAASITDPSLLLTLLGGTVSALYDPATQSNIRLGFQAVKSVKNLCKVSN